MSSIDAEHAGPVRKRPAAATAVEWWRGAVIYHVYPRSFRDSNGDGVGDLKGVIDGLDYIASLGVDGVWLSPFFKSPMRDFGYDVADYCDVDPIFGSLSDFDRLIEKAHALGLKVIIDQVYSHTSDEHPWFAESRADRTNPKADWYVWADPKPDGSPPNNWLSVFGGGSWTWDSRRRQYYFHNFLSTQPDLNLHNPEVQNAILDVAKFWLEHGVDGFRLDAINFAMHDPQLRDNPPAANLAQPPVRPFEYQQHIRSQSHPDIPRFLERIRKLTDQYDGIFTVAEVGGVDALDEMKAFTADDAHLNSAYNFSFLYADKITVDHTSKVVSAWGRAPGEGWPSWAFSNHDAPRAASRWAKEENLLQASRLYAMILMCLRGNAFLYQGEELGLPQADIPFEALQDPEAVANWPDTLNRDGARSPLPWAAAEVNAGFSSAAPWLPVDPRHYRLAVDLQEKDGASTLNFIRKLIEIRKQTPALRYGDIAFAAEADQLLAFYRKTDAQEVLCAFNINSKEHSWRPLGQERYTRLIDIGLEQNGGGLPETLAPLSGYIAIRKT